MGALGPMTEAMYYILLALLAPSHGYQLMAAVAEASRGRWSWPAKGRSGA